MVGRRKKDANCVEKKLRMAQVVWWWSLEAVDDGVLEVNRMSTHHGLLSRLQLLPAGTRLAGIVWRASVPHKPLFLV